MDKEKLKEEIKETLKALKTQDKIYQAFIEALKKEDDNNK
jgi:hypothetical protein